MLQVQGSPLPGVEGAREGRPYDVFSLPHAYGRLDKGRSGP